MHVGGQPGNKNGSKNKPWREALDWASKHHKRSVTDQAQALRDIALTVFDRALDGDMTAVKELGDRFDGKSVQGVTIDATVDLSGMPVDDLMSLFKQIRDAVDTPES